MTYQDSYTLEEKEFIDRLESFRVDLEDSIAYFYAFLSINNVASQNEKILKIINKTPFFWRTVEKALINSFYISLAKIFDPDHRAKSNLDKLISFAQDNIKIFSYKNLKERKIKSSPKSHEWLENYMKDVYITTVDDFIELRNKLSFYKKIHNKSYMIIRNKIIAHMEFGIFDDKNHLFSKTDINEITELLKFLYQVYFALFQSFHNGRKLELQPLDFNMKYLIQI